MIKEIYKPVENFTFLEVSNFWNYRVVWEGRARIEYLQGRPYIKAQKEILEDIYFTPVHIAVANLFLGREEEMKKRSNVVVCHVDDNPNNNSVLNLYLGNPKSNGRDYARNRYFRSIRDRIFLNILTLNF